MKNYFEFHGTTQRLVFDPISKAFVARAVAHPFFHQRDPLEERLLADLGLDAKAFDRGELKLVA
jgi:hypothetical protein